MAVGLVARPLNYSSGQVSVNISAGGTVTQNSAFPYTNVANNDFGRVFKATGITAGSIIYIAVDYGVAVTVDTVAALWMQGHKSSDTLIIQGSNDNFATTPYSASAQMSTGSTSRDFMNSWKHLRTISPSQTYRYWRVGFQFVTACAAFSVSRLIFCRSAQFVIGAAKCVISAVDMNTQVTTEIGESRSQEDPTLIRPSVSLAFSYAKQSEMEAILGPYTLNMGTSRPLLICADLSSAYIQDNTVFGRPSQVMAMQSDTYDVWQFEANAVSLGP